MSRSPVSKNILFVFTALICSFQALADAITASDAWARPTFALATTGAAYLTLQNSSGADDKLVAVSVSESIARKAEIHDHIMQDDMMKMIHLEDGIEIAAGSSVAFAPGGKHIMLMGLTGPLEEGQSLDVTLYFEKSGQQVISIPVGELDGEQNKGHHHH